MREKLAAVALLGTLLAFQAPSSIAAPAPCSILTSSEVGAALGIQVDEGSPLATRTCKWTGVGKQSSRRVMLSMLTISSFAVGKTPLAGTEKPALSGIGDEAYFKYFSAPRYEKVQVVDLQVRKGEQVFGVEVWGLSVEEAKEAAKALAIRVLAKL